MGRVLLAADVRDIEWFDEHGENIAPEAWNNAEERTLVLRRAARLADGSILMLTLMLNPGDADCRFVIPPPRHGGRLLLDTAQPQAPAREIGNAETMVVRSRAAVLLEAEAAGPARTASPAEPSE